MSTTTSLTVTASVSGVGSASESLSGSGSASGSGIASETGTETATRTQSVTAATASDDSSGTVTETATVDVTATYRMVPSATEAPSETWRRTASENGTSGTRTRTRSALVTVTRSLAVSATAVVSASRGTPSVTKTRALSLSRTWGCVNATRLAGVLAAYVAAALRASVTDAAVRNGTVAVVELPAVAGLGDEGLHVPWFEPYAVNVSVRVLSAPNQRGFAAWTGYTAGIRIVFPQGLGAPVLAGGDGSGASVPAVVVVPPLGDFVIYAAERVMLEMRLSDATLGSLCGAASSGASSTVLGLVELDVAPDSDSLLAAAQAVLGPVIAVVTAAVPFAAPDVQALVMVSMLPCSNTYQRRTYAMFRALSLFTLDDSYEGVLWGNLVANVLGLGVHAGAVVAVAAVKHVPLAEATTIARFPSVYLQLLWQLTFSSNAFAAAQLLSDPDATAVGGGSRALAALMLAGFCVAVPAALGVYVMRFVEAYYRVYEYHKWRRSETALRVRLLSTFLLPVGRWEPEEVRRRLGPVLTLQSRPEFVWMLLPLASPVLVALFSLARGQSERVCVWLYVLLAVLHMCLMAAVAILRPLRSMLEDWLAFAALAITTAYLMLSAVNLAEPALAWVQAVLGAAAILQLVLLAVRLLYHIAHVFVARRLVGVVPSRLLFEWNRGSAFVEEAGGSEMPKDRLGGLYDELEDLLMQGDAAGDDDACSDAGEEMTEQPALADLLGLRASNEGDANGADDGEFGGDILRIALSRKPAAADNKSVEKSIDDLLL